VITPAEPISMFAMLIPLYGLFELGILLLRIAPARAVAEGRMEPWRR
jgi:Sec-independent protein secretion pathway component TatC